jgi:peroxiredoxin
MVTLDTLRAERRPIVLIFSDPDCGPCSALLPEIARWELEHAATLTIALISRGSQKANRARIGEHRLRYVLLQKDREVAVAYRANGTPAAVLISPDGRIESFLAMGSQAIAGLVGTGAGTLPAASVPTKGTYGSGSVPPAAPIELKIGHPAPSLKLPDLGGKVVDLSTFRGRETLVLFWNPSCGFCGRMLPDLRQWEEHRPAEAPRLLVVSTGAVEANRALGLRAPVVLDQTFASGLEFHVRGTPAAVLVDAEGKIASGVASGAPAVFALANGHRGISV